MGDISFADRRLVPSSGEPRVHPVLASRGHPVQDSAGRSAGQVCENGVGRRRHRRSEAAAVFFLVKMVGLCGIVSGLNTNKPEDGIEKGTICGKETMGGQGPVYQLRHLHRQLPAGVSL